MTSSDKNNLILPAATAELYLKPEQQDLLQASAYVGKEGFGHGGRVCAVLGAGNHVRPQLGGSRWLVLFGAGQVPGEGGGWEWRVCRGKAVPVRGRSLLNGIRPT